MARPGLRDRAHSGYSRLLNSPLPGRPMTSSFLDRLLPLFLAGFAPACSGDSTGPEPPAPDPVALEVTLATRGGTVVASGATATVGDTLIATARARGADGSPVDAAVQWRVLPEHGTLVSTQARTGASGAAAVWVLGTRPGAAEIHVAVQSGNLRTSVDVETQAAPAASLRLAGDTLYGFQRGFVDLEVTAVDRFGNPTAVPAGVVWESSDPAVATVSPAGRVTIAGAGATRVTATAAAARGAAVFVGLEPVSLDRTMASGDEHSCGLRQGTVVCWGKNYFAQLGRGTSSGVHPDPEPVAGTVRFSSVHSVIGHYTCALSSDQRAYCWGTGAIGQETEGGCTRPLPYEPCIDRPTEIPGNLRFRQVSTSASHACGLTVSGEAYCWGDNAFGELGDGVGSAGSVAPQRVRHEFAGLAAIYAGTNRTCVLTAAGTAYCWGANDSGELGTGSTGSCSASGGAWACSLTPLEVSGGHRFRHLDLQGRHTCGITMEGEAYCWGDNRLGTLGIGHNSEMKVGPLPVAGGLRFASIATGGIHTCGITTSARLYCWGTNRYGNLGTGSTAESHLPAAVASGVAFKEVVLGWRHSCAVSVQDDLYCWGDNAAGQVGDGTLGTSRLRPTRVRK